MAITLRQMFEVGFRMGKAAAAGPGGFVSPEWWDELRPGGLPFEERPEAPDGQWALAESAAWKVVVSELAEKQAAMGGVATDAYGQVSTGGEE